MCRTGARSNMVPTLFDSMVGGGAFSARKCIDAGGCGPPMVALTD
jgi:hypothetical protein